ncbi:hypothetical protein GSI_11293 [Ganoderma sinense ZZ0214-1]|uniref:Uncharacterized protein n=1 Tax=Ganoderma sinense ZZ0214-1 TaxID=1077348 RepID=A0A2G8RYR7_9APHY|nr:hypothetical protein GSI_11293 [Ganoderma sinense ZZ0214-1]
MVFLRTPTPTAINVFGPSIKPFHCSTAELDHDVDIPRTAPSTGLSCPTPLPPECRHPQSTQIFATGRAEKSAAPRDHIPHTTRLRDTGSCSVDITVGAVHICVPIRSTFRCTSYIETSGSIAGSSCRGVLKEGVEKAWEQVLADFVSLERFVVDDPRGVDEDAFLLYAKPLRLRQGPRWVSRGFAERDEMGR